MAVFESGLMWGGKFHDGNTPVLRVNGQSYNEGTKRGAILGIRTGIAEDPDAPDVRLWKVSMRETGSNGQRARERLSMTRMEMDFILPRSWVACPCSFPIQTNQASPMAIRFSGMFAYWCRAALDKRGIGSPCHWYSQGDPA